MKKTLVSFVICMLLITTTGIVLGDWDPDDGHKMHFPQLPDPIGWDVYATQGIGLFPDIILGDDWTCSETGWVMDIHFWGSWWRDRVGDIRYFDISIAEDIPADPPEIPYSRPGEILWNHQFDEWVERGPYEGEQGFYDPWDGFTSYPNHNLYYQYNIFLDEEKWFWQEKDKVYWLLISVNVTDPGINPENWGWKSSPNHHLDGAVWSYVNDINWVEMYEPDKPPVNNQFWVEFDLEGNLVPGTSGGTDFYDDGTSTNGWYYYPNTDWWNIWFYDHPLDKNKYKEMFVSFTIWPREPGISWFSFALNWATDAWPSGDPPPIPPLTPSEESMYVGREIFSEIYTLWEPLTVEIPFSIIEYNPEWVSVDIMGSGVFILPDNPGRLQHQCLFKEPQSLDLAFVITGRFPIPDLVCDGSLTWREVKPGDTVTGTFTVTNDGEPGSLLDWEVTDYPVWGTWTFTPSSGTDLPKGSSTTVSVSVVAPSDEETDFTGNVTVCNKEDTTDCCLIPVTLSTPVVQNSIALQILYRILERFPVIKQIVMVLFQ